MNKQESIQKIQDQIEKVKEYIEYGMPYGEYLQLQLAFEDIVNLIEKQSKEIKELEKYKTYYDNAKVVWSRNDYISKDKIKAKIKELDKEEKEELKGTKGQDRYAIKQEYMHKRSGVQSLLEKE